MMRKKSAVREMESAEGGRLRLETEELRSAISRKKFLHLERWSGSIAFDLGDVEQYLFAGAPFAEGRLMVVRSQASSTDAAGLRVSDVHRRFAAGDSLVLRRAHRSIPKLARLAADMATCLDAEVRINVYITPPDSAGFPLHYDDHDVVMLQTFGEKHWQIRARTAKPVDLSELSPLQRAVVAASSQHGPARSRKSAKSEIRLTEGGLLYLPSGVPHCGVAGSAASIHLTASIRNPSAAEIDSLKTFATRLGCGTRSRASDPEQSDWMIQSLIELRREKECVPTPSRHLESLSTLAFMTDETWCEWRPNLKPRLSRFGEVLIVVFHESSIVVEEALLPMWEYVVSTPSFRVASLPLECADERRVAAMELVRAGLLQVVDDCEQL